MLSLQSFLREGRAVGPCWEKFKPTGPKAWPYYRTIPGARLCWVLEEAEGPKMEGREGWGERAEKGVPQGGTMSRVAQQGDNMGTLHRGRQAGIASDRSLIERWEMADSLVALLNIFLLICDTCLDSTECH